MSLSYLQTILPLEDDAAKADELPIQNISEKQLGSLSARFMNHADSFKPFKDNLVPVEQFFVSFNELVKHLSETLVQLRLKSASLAEGLDDKRDLVTKLNPVILDLMIPPTVASLILKDPVDEKWNENVRFLGEKRQLAKNIRSDGSPMSSYKDTQALIDLEEGLDLLEAKAIERIRDYVVGQIRNLRRSPKSSSQKVQELLLRVKDLFLFLAKMHPGLANQLQMAYILTMRWYYTTRFAKYLYALQKLRLKHIDSQYVLGGTADVLLPKTTFFGFGEPISGASSALASPVGSRPSNSEYFASASKRISLLEENGPGRERQHAIPSQIAESTPFMYWVEFPFQQWLAALVDNIIVEYLFMVEFFFEGKEKFEPVKNLDPSIEQSYKLTGDWAHVMFADVLKTGTEYAQWLVTLQLSTVTSRLVSAEPTCDLYGVLLMIRSVQLHNRTLHNELRVPVLDDYHNLVLLQLWPHVTRIVDINCDSMKRNFLGSSASYGGRPETNQAPTNTTQQFSQLLVGLLKLAFVFDEKGERTSLYEPLLMSITRLRNDFESALTRASARVFLSKKNATQKEIFLFNNYFLIVTIMRSEFPNTVHQYIADQIEHFSLLCDAYRRK